MYTVAAECNGVVFVDGRRREADQHNGKRQRALHGQQQIRSGVYVDAASLSPGTHNSRSVYSARVILLAYLFIQLVTRSRGDPVPIGLTDIPLWLVSVDEFECRRFCYFFDVLHICDRKIN